MTEPTPIQQAGRQMLEAVHRRDPLHNGELAEAMGDLPATSLALQRTLTRLIVYGKWLRDESWKPERAPEPRE